MNDARGVDTFLCGLRELDMLAVHGFFVNIHSSRVSAEGE